MALTDCPIFPLVWRADLAQPPAIDSTLLANSLWLGKPAGLIWKNMSYFWETSGVFGGASYEIS
eukprot:5059491-Pleurochrysis_carterae.AAC.1